MSWPHLFSIHCQTTDGRGVAPSTLALGCQVPWILKHPRKNYAPETYPRFLFVHAIVKKL